MVRVNFEVYPREVIRVGEELLISYEVFNDGFSPVFIVSIKEAILPDFEVMEADKAFFGRALLIYKELRPGELERYVVRCKPRRPGEFKFSPILELESGLNIPIGVLTIRVIGGRALSIFSIMDIIMSVAELTGSLERRVSFSRNAREIFRKRAEALRFIDALSSWFSSVSKLPDMIRVRFEGMDRGFLEIKEYLLRARKFSVGDRVEVEGVFSRFFPIIMDNSIREIVEDLKLKLRMLSEGLDSFLSRLGGEELYPMDFQSLLNFLEFGDEFRFRTTAVIRDVPIKKGEQYFFLSALYNNKATVNIGCIPVIICSDSPIEPKYHTFYARLRGYVGEVRIGDKVVRPIIVKDWEEIERLDRDAVLYLSQWALVRVANSEDAFIIAPRCDLANKKSYEIAREFIRNVIDSESKVFKKELRVIIESDMVDRIYPYNRQRAISELVKLGERG